MVKIILTLRSILFNGPEGALILFSGPEGALILFSGPEGALILFNGPEGALIIFSGPEGALILFNGPEGALIIFTLRSKLSMFKIILMYKYFTISNKNMFFIGNYLTGATPFTTPATMKHPPRDDIITFFFQGNGESRAQASLYAGPQGIRMMVEDADVDVHCAEAPCLLHNIWQYPELQDVTYNPWNPMVWVAKPVRTLVNWYRGIEGAVAHAPVLREWNLGGTSDVQQYLVWFRDLLATAPVEKKLVLFGCSRGASTTFTAVSQMTPEEHQRISLVILEAPFDSVEHVIEHSPWLPNLQMGLLTHCTSYNASDISPQTASESWPLTVPVAFITSDADTRVPKALTQNLIAQLLSRGHEKVHHCELQTSHHILFPLHNPDDQQRYFDFVNAMYALYI